MEQPFFLALLAYLAVLGLFQPAVSAATAASTAPPTRPASNFSLHPDRPGATSATIRLARGGRMLLVPVRINGEDAGLFIVDLGASHVVIDETLAHRLRLPEIGQAEAHAIGGRAKVHVHPVDSLTIGASGDGDAKGPGFTFRNLFVASGDLSSFRREGGMERLEGLIGVDTLEHTPFVLDWRNATLTVTPADRFKPPGGMIEHRLRATPSPAAQLKLRDDLSGWFELDTGGDGGIRFNSGFAKLATDYLEPMPRTRSTSLGVGGFTQAWDVSLPTVEMLGERLENVEGTYSLDAGLTIRDDVAGAVGMQVLQDFQLAIDLRAGKVWTSPRRRSVPAEWDRPDLDLKAVDAAGRTPLLAAADLERGDYVRKFLAGGADPLAVDTIGFTALHGAASAGDVELVRVLLDAGVSANASTRNQVTPLHAAARAGSAAAIELLRARGARLDDTDTRSRSALMYAATRRRAAAVAALLKAGADPNVLSPGFGTALHAAAAAEDAGIVDALLRAGAKTELRTAPSLGGATPLVVAAFGHSTEVVKLLLDHGADVNATSAKGETPLMAAASQHRTEIVDLLLARGADPAIRDGDGDTALQWAAAKGYLELVARLYRAPTTRPAAP